MLKAYVVTPKWDGDFMPSGTKIIIAESLAEAGEALREWANGYLEEERKRYPELVDFNFDWRLEERPLERGILWDTGIRWLSETP